MAIEFVCPACQGTLRVGDESAGQVVRCGSCMSTLRVPNGALEAPPPTAPPPRRPVRPLEPRTADDRDEHGEPRPRRRGKKVGGRGVLFWLVVISLGLGLLTCLACGGLTLILATPRWHEHESAEGGYKVQYPAQLNANMADQAKKPRKPNEFMEGALLVGRLEVYWVWYADLDAVGRNLASETVLKKTVENLAAEAGGAVFSDVPKTLEGGYPAHEVVLVLHDDEALHCLVVVANGRVYIAAAGGPFVDTGGNERIRTFLDSFKIIPQPAGGNPWRGIGKKKPKN
jgi:hypothetical protein